MFSNLICKIECIKVMPTHLNCYCDWCLLRRRNLELQINVRLQQCTYLSPLAAIKTALHWRLAANDAQTGGSCSQSCFASKKGGDHASLGGFVMRAYAVVVLFMAPAQLMVTDAVQGGLVASSGGGTKKGWGAV